MSSPVFPYTVQGFAWYWAEHNDPEWVGHNIKWLQRRDPAAAAQLELELALAGHRWILSDDEPFA